MKGALLLLLRIQRKAEAGGINPALAELAQTPCSLVLRQGICDPRQLRGIGDCSKAVVLFGEADSGILRLTGPLYGGLSLTCHIFVAVQDDLRPERRVATHFDCQMAPVRIEDMKGIMIHRPGAQPNKR